MKNILFIDVDGTLVTSMDGVQFIPPSALAAMEEVRQRGGRVYLCTGRSLAEALTIGEVPIDGIIGAAGGFVLDGEQMVFHQMLSADDIMDLEAFLREHGATYYLESNDGLYFDKPFLRIVRTEWGIDEENEWNNIVHPVEEADRSRVNKVSFYSDGVDLSYEDMMERFADRFCIVRITRGDPQSVAGEISCFGVNKATAIARLLEYLDLPDVRTFGFGDSMNDIEMLDACDEAIVMGDAREPSTREHATYVTRDLLDDGIAHAMRHFGLID